jgi:DNA-binding winged helix-turn-helix (wHTH) protein
MGEPNPRSSGEARPPARRWIFGPAVLDESTLELRVNDAPVHLERKPLETLLHLLHHAGEVVTKDELQAAVWPGRFLSESVLTNCVSRIRDALADDDQTIIKTVHGFGYRLAAPVSVETRTAPAPPRLDFKAGEAPPQRPLWRFTTCLGAGGRGEVWLALHGKTSEPRVFKYALDGSALASLKREITLYRVLRETLPDRDDYVAILDWNLEEAPYFIEAEYTAGGNLAEWAAARGGLAAVPLATRLNLLAQIAETLAAAHSVGVLHKDLKPANVLVVPDEVRPRIKIGDFGSGVLLDPATLDALGITQLDFSKSAAADGATSTTPLYIAPEVIGGQPFTLQSDIYALGVILYQLVAGDFRKPLAPGWEKEVGDELLREDVAAAAAGNPADRLRDAAELARRLRTLEQRRSERAAARAAELRAVAERAQIERTRQMLERARLRRTWMAATIGVLLLGLTATTALFFQARRASQEASAVSSFLLDDMLAMASPYQGPIQDLTFRQVLDRAATVVDERFAAQPAVASRVHLALGQSYWWLRQPEAARGQFEQAAEGFERFAGADDPLAQRAREGVARALLEEDPQSSLATLEQIAARLTHDLPPRHPRAIQARMQAAVARAAVDHAQAIKDLRAVGEEARQADWSLLSAADRSFHFRNYGDAIKGDELAEEARLYLGTLLAKTGDAAAAADVLRPVVAYHESRYGDAHYSTALARMNLAAALIRSGRDVDAEPELLRAVQDLQTWLGPDHEDAKLAEFGAASLRLEQGRLDEARVLYEDVARRCVASGCAARLAHASNHMLAIVNLRLGELGDAAASMRSAVANAERAFGPEAPETLYSRSLLASLLQQQGDAAGAREVYETLLRSCQSADESPHCLRLQQAVAGPR